MKVIIRKPKLKPEIGGIPKDFAEVKTYFNKALKDNTLSWIPRKNKITNNEIKNLWIPTLETNITLVAELEGKTVGQITVFYDTKSTGYEHAEQRVRGNIGFSARPDVYKQVIKLLVPELIDEFKKTK
jgi:glycerophosphoryl diester phosphodiesterase